MPTRTVTVGSAVGLHARPAAIIAEAAGELDSEVTIGVPGDDPVDAPVAEQGQRRAQFRGVVVDVGDQPKAHRPPPPEGERTAATSAGPRSRRSPTCIG